MPKTNLNIALFGVPALIWGSTWFVIKYQLGIVPPIMSVVYRFFIASVLVLTGCAIFKIPLKYKVQDHLLFLVLGCCLFGFNYWMVYEAELYLTSGLIAVIFSLVLFSNMFMAILILKRPFKLNLLVGAILGVSGTLLIFQKEFQQLGTNKNMNTALILCSVSMIVVSFGNIMASLINKRNIGVVPSTGYAMLYGAAILFMVSLFVGYEVKFDMSKSYLLSLFYLVALGSIVAFLFYLKLLGRIGPENSAYVVVAIPIIAMVVSTIFEGYEWQQSAFYGMPVLIFGNIIALAGDALIKKVSIWK